ncbi:MAG: Hsp20/alpha crystallin family protein [Phycisphaeraceae bacterium]|nr:Hsp20/alpha crystallin family protein [Phycisphaeraceae bacterium]
MLPATRNNVRNLWNDPFDALYKFMGKMPDYSSEETDLLGRYPVDVHEDDNHLYIDAEMPGFNKDQVDVSLEEGTLTIRGQRDVQSENKGHKHLHERRFSKIERSFTLPSSVDESAVEAKLTDGVLKIKLNKREEVKKRKIQVD